MLEECEDSRTFWVRTLVDDASAVVIALVVYLILVADINREYKTLRGKIKRDWSIYSALILCVGAVICSSAIFYFKLHTIIWHKL